WNELNRLTWEDEKPPGIERMTRPASQVMVDQILNDPHGEFFDDADTDGTVETLADVVHLAFRAAVANLEKRLGPFGETWRWGIVKGTQLRHVARIPGLGRDKLVADGVGHVIDAIDAVWAPSWRMVVELGPEVKAWGNYPGGQSGNPGSKFYDDFVNDWAAGKPYELVFLKSADEPNPAVVGRTLMRGEK
ncbi:MAG: penicillin acylase family protein, partial [Candidatus Aminicenantes bacterium]|nr:penicillin acylase family protein [Candidatus Aminicenantes bacterium]